MGDIGTGGGTSYPNALDTQNTPESGTTVARADVPNDLAAAILAVEGELGIDPAGNQSDLVTYLQEEHEIDGTHGDITPTKVNMEGDFTQLLGVEISSQTALPVGVDGNIFSVTGTVNVDTIATKGAGTVIILRAADGFSLVNDDDNLDLVNNVFVAAGTSATLYEYVEGKWRLTGLSEQQVPTGATLAFPGTTAPTGWLLCNGATLNATSNPEFAALFAVLGVTFGGSGIADFDLPNVVDRFIVGSGSTYSLGEKAGSLISGNTTLTTAQLTTMSFLYDKPDTSIGVDGDDPNDRYCMKTTNVVDSPNTPITQDFRSLATNTQGSSLSHNHPNTIPPYIGMAAIIKI